MQEKEPGRAKVKSDKQQIEVVETFVEKVFFKALQFHVFTHTYTHMLGKYWGKKSNRNFRGGGSRRQVTTLLSQPSRLVLIQIGYKDS